MTDGAAATRAAFLAQLGFDPDPFQVDAMDALDAGQSVLVAAPTGSGKTLVAEYAVARAVDEGGKAFYTTPLKALSNQKFGDLAARHGKDKVGLLTGDNAINGDAPVVVMTTEVLRNMIYAGSPALVGLRYVVLDEVHYLQNPYRGAVWEEVIIHTPPEVDLVCLSATVSNAEEVADWIQTVRGATAAIIEERRPVELRHLYLVGDRDSGDVLMLPMFVDGRPNPEAAGFSTVARPDARGRRPRGAYFTPNRIEIVDLLRQHDLLPAITFIFSRAACDDAVRQCLAGGIRLTTPEERRQIRAIVDAKVEPLSDADLDVLDFGAFLVAMENGIAAHHAGMVPPFKEAVEACFSAALVKAVFATETLSLGINMPARTVVIERLQKFDGESRKKLEPGEYTQLTGRAGRRGIDAIGYAAALWSPYTRFEEVAELAAKRIYHLQSSFRPTYNMAANLVRRYRPDTAHHLLNLSFAQYQADSGIVRREAELERVTRNLAHARADAECERGDVYEYRALIDTAKAATRPRPTDAAAVAAALARLRPGDVVAVPRLGPVAIVATSERRGGDVRATVVTRDGRRLTRGPRDFPAPPVSMGHVQLPVPFAPKSHRFINEVAIRLRKAKLHDRGDAPKGSRDAGEQTMAAARAAAAHPVAACPDAEKHVRAVSQIEKLEADVTRRERAIRQRSESLARQFDRVLQILDEWRYVEGWALTAAGERLCRIYHECDLLIADCLEDSLFDSLDDAEVAAVASMFTYEFRGQGTPPEGIFPTAEIRRRWETIERRANELNGLEDRIGLPMTRFPDPGFVHLAHAWASGKDLDDVVAGEDVPVGDFVRNVKQLIDLLRQLGAVAAARETSESCHRAADSLFRGVIAASSVVVTPA